MDVQTQIDRAAFPEHVRVTTYEEMDGRIFRIMRREGDVKYGLEILLTDEAVNMYGEEPMVATVLQQLHQHAEQGLPVVEAGQEYQRLTFVAD
ncbi:hypothetical protein DKM44_10120 [Deinococcus irradiatisoli]|uniref:Uncharacterized protein n=1 Tax=Deinococcus irradiatisoli TaxID=2202254 RepID=A0A2Z3JHK7_9DEIO|nr:hypothetical protein [Deinococcus irradiatisoli]AWN23536.1 hypothetical protein DKM44_10120 [Deinococcus irradiatisoli]